VELRRGCGVAAESGEGGARKGGKGRRGEKVSTQLLSLSC
jgi:hypothetical protein